MWHGDIEKQFNLSESKHCFRMIKRLEFLHTLQQCFLVYPYHASFDLGTE